MDDGEANVSLLATARHRLSVSLEEASLQSSAIEETSSRMDSIKYKLQFYGTEVSSSHAQMCKVTSATERINRAVGPVAAALKAHDTVCELEALLISSICHECPLNDYLLIVIQIEGALRFLGNACELAVEWTEDIVQPPDEDEDVTADYELNVMRTLRILKNMKAIEARARLKGSFLSNALDKLELELRRLLNEESNPHSRLPDDRAIQKIHAILERLKANGRLENSTNVYVDVRSSSTRATLQVLNLNYLGMQVSPSESVHDIVNHISRWGMHLEFAVKHVLKPEYALCRKVFKKIGPDVAAECFVRTISRCGFLALLRFGNKVTETKKDAAKLLKLLEIFGILNKLRSNFSRLFSGKDGIEMQTLTRELIKKVVDEAFEIFMELPNQVELHRSTPPPSDGSIPRSVMFVTSYCIKLLEDDYQSTLAVIMSIHDAGNDYNKDSTDSTILRDEFCRIVRALEINLETWSKSYTDNAQARFFLMNNYWYLHEKIKGTKLAELMGEEWCRRLGENTLYFSKVYQTESWGKLPAILSEDGLLLFPPGRTTTAHELVHKRLQRFNDAFESMCKRQCHWDVNDECMREMVCRLIVQTIVPGYKRYLHDNAFQEADKGSRTTDKYVKYSALHMEALINRLFQGKIEDSIVGNEAAYSTGKISSIVPNQFRMSLITA